MFRTIQTATGPRVTMTTPTLLLGAKSGPTRRHRTHRRGAPQNAEEKCNYCDSAARRGGSDRARTAPPPTPGITPEPLSRDLSRPQEVPRRTAYGRCSLQSYDQIPWASVHPCASVQNF